MQVELSGKQLVEMVHSLDTRICDLQLRINLNKHQLQWQSKDATEAASLEHYYLHKLGAARGLREYLFPLLQSIDEEG